VATETYELQIHGIHSHEDVENVIHFTGVGLNAGDTFFNSKDLIDSFIQDAQAKWLAMMPGTYFLNRYSARRQGFSHSATYHVQGVLGSNSGTGGAACQSLNVCPVIRLIPPMGVKSGGKIYLPAIPDGMIEDNAYTAPYVTAVGAFMTQVLTTGIATTAITWKIAIFSRKLDLFSGVIGWTLSRTLGWQGGRRKVV
jgi:hypothetical protein